MLTGWDKKWNCNWLNENSNFNRREKRNNANLYIYLQGKKQHPRAMNALLTLGLPILPHLKKITRLTQRNSLSCWKRKSASLLVFKILSFI